MIQAFVGAEPGKVDGQNAIITEYYRKRLRTVIKGRFKVECPEDWDKDYFLNMLITRGNFLVTDSQIGVKPFRCSLHGLNYMNLPVYASITNPILGHFDRTLDEDAVLIYMERMFGNTYFTFNDLVTFYAYKLASVDISMDVNLMNTRLAHVVEVESKNQAEAVQNAYDKISEGEPLVVVRKDTLSGSGVNAMFNSVSQSYIVNDLIDSKRSIMNEFLTAIGVNNANTDKKERVIESEVSANDMELTGNIKLFNERLGEQCDKASSLLGIKLHLEMEEYEPPKMGVMGNDINGRGGDMGKDSRKES